MVVFPNAKINLGLSVMSKRSDGYHELETVFYPVSIKDALEIIAGHPAESTKRANNFPGLHFSSSGLPIAGDAKNNLCIKAYDLLAADFQEIAPLQLHLHKNIPMGAGLGGGSADGAFTLRLLNDLFQLNLSRQQLINYAAQLGSDCPFFIINKPCFATSRGEIMEEIDLDLSACKMVFVNPGIHINTGWAFSQLQLSALGQTGESIRQIIAQPVKLWKDLLKNDFEAPVFRAYPEIQHVKESLYRAGAVYASMSGSGSTVFGLFDTDVPGLEFPPHYTVIKTP